MNELSSSITRPDLGPQAAGLALHVQLLDSLQEGVSISTQAGTIVYTNPAEDRLFGYGPGELIGRHVSEQNAYPEEESARLVQAVMDELNQNGVWRGEWVNKRKDGSTFLTSSHIMPVTWNGAAHWLCVQRDITLGEAPDTRLALAAEAAELGIWDWDLISNRFDYSKRAKAICGFAPDAEVTYEDVVAVTHPEDFPVTSAQAARALDPDLRDRSPYEYRLRLGDGQIRWVRACGYAVFGIHAGEHRALRYVGTLEDITTQKLAREAERAAADQLRLALEAADMAVWRADLKHRTLSHSPKLNLIHGLDPDALPSLEQLEAMRSPDTGADLSQSWAGALARQAPSFDAEFAILRPDGERRWLQVRCEIHYEAGEPFEAIGVLSDVTERRRVQEALRESDRRFREAANSAPAPVWMTNRSGQIEFCNEAMLGFAGVGAEAALGDYWISLLHPEDGPSVAEERARAWSDNHRPYEFEARFRRADGQWRWLHVASQPRRDAAGAFHGYVGIAMDRTELREALAARDLLINELNHRVKNTLATVQSLAMQSLRNAANTDAAREAFLARLQALAGAHDLLTEQNWRGAELAQVVEGAISVFGFERRFFVSGPAVQLTPRQALSVSLALHELATNAMKYGALASETGRVEISWSIAEEAGARRLRLEWRERGGPVVAAPARLGFGARLINQHLSRDLDAPARVDFLPEGVFAFLECQLLEAPPGRS